MTDGEGQLQWRGRPPERPAARRPFDAEAKHTVRIATLGISLVLSAVAAGVYLLGLPVLGISMLLVIAVATFFVLTHRDAATVLTVFAVLLLMIPSRYVVEILGALGTPAKLIGFGALVLWLASRLTQDFPADHGQQPMRQALLVYIWWMLIVYATAFFRPLTELEAGSAHRTALTLVTLVGIALLAADGVVHRDRLEVVLRRVVTMTGISAIIGILQYFHVDIVPHLQAPGLVVNGELVSIAERAHSEFARVSGTAIHAIEFGVVLAVVAPFALHFAMYDRRRRTAAWFWATVILFAIPTSVSRATVIGIGVALIVLAVRWNWNQRLWLLVFGLVGLAVTRAVAPGLLGTIRSLFLWWSEDDSVQARTDDYGPVYNYVSDSPWVGRGLGTFEPTQYLFVDNEWLMVAVTTGVIGVVTFLLLFSVGIACARGVIRRAHDDATAHLGQAFIASLLTLVVTFGTFDGLSFNISAGILFLLLGLVGAFWRIEVGDWRSGRDDDGRLPRPVRGTSGPRPAPARGVEAPVQ